jgi:hypothetical protein
VDVFHVLDIGTEGKISGAPRAAALAEHSRRRTPVVHVTVHAYALSRAHALTPAPRSCARWHVPTPADARSVTPRV